MEVVGLARSEKAGGTFRVYPQAQLHAFLANLDVVVNTLPLTSATRQLFDGSAFDAMMPGAWFLNMGRGGTVEESALIDRLQSGHLGGAILDVFEVEPLPVDSSLWNLPNAIVTPHISGPTLPEEVVEVFLRQPAPVSGRRGAARRGRASDRVLIREQPCTRPPSTPRSSPS